MNTQILTQKESVFAHLMRNSLNINGNTIKEFREKYRLSQTAFAKILNVSMRTVQVWESKNEIPTNSQPNVKVSMQDYAKSVRKDESYVLDDSLDVVKESAVEYATETGVRLLRMIESYIPDEMQDVVGKMEAELVDLYEYKELYFKAKEAFRPK